MTAPVTLAAVPQPPFEIPPIITYAVPGFVLLILLEMIYVRVTKRGRYEARDSAGESINLGVADLGDIVFVTQVESREMVRAIGKPGFRAPLHGTSMGQAILAAMAEDDVLRYLRAYGLPRLTDNTIARASRLHEALGEVRRAGYAIDDEQNALGLRCIAAAIRDEHGQPFAAISLVGPTQRIKCTDFASLGAAVRAAADEITGCYGGRLR